MTTHLRAKSSIITKIFGTFLELIFQFLFQEKVNNLVKGPLLYEDNYDIKPDPTKNR